MLLEKNACQAEQLQKVAALLCGSLDKKVTPTKSSGV